MRLTVFFLLIGLCAQAQVKNYKLGEVQNGPLAGASVAVSPRNNKNIVAYAAGKLFVSNDAGTTWKASLDISPDSKGTPKVAADAKGNFFVIYSSLKQIVSQSSTDDGKTWSAPVAVGLPGGDQFNPGIIAHPRKEMLMVTWTQAGQLGTESDTCKSNVMLSTSTNGGKKWSKPLKVNQNAGNCVDEDFTLRGSTPIIGADGKLFVIWASQGAMFYDRSYDGNMWISTDLAITEQVGGWTLTIPGFGNLANTPTATIDNSASRIHGTLFLVYSDLKSGDKDSDIWLTRSVNRGDNWTVAARINQDKPGHDQFLPRISIDPSNGYVYIIYYDRRDYTDNQTDVYLAWSTDGGNQFKEKKITEKPFVADINSGYMADYIDLSVQKGIVAIVWSGSENGLQTVSTSIIKHEDLAK